MRNEDPEVIDRLLAAARARAAAAAAPAGRSRLRGPSPRGGRHRRARRAAKVVARPPALRRRVQVLAGSTAAALVLVAIVALATHPPARATLRPRGVRATVPAVPKGAVSSAPSPPSELVELVPAAWRSRCRRAPALDSLTHDAIVCRPGPGAPATVEVRRYDDDVAMTRAFGRLAAGTPVGGATATPRCAAGGAENRAWRPGPSTRRGDAPATDAIGGRYACRRDAAGAHLAWTEPRALLVLQANRVDDRLDALFSWWVRAPL